MNLLGIIGNPVAHSKSPDIFKSFFYNENLKNWKYDLFPVDNILSFPEFIEKNKDLVGLNVTLPFKQQIMPYLNWIDPLANEIRAVNTIKIFNRNNAKYLAGFNTDIYGFEKSLLESFGTHHKGALILGTGGSSKAVIAALQKLSIPFKLVSRSLDFELRYDLLGAEHFHEHDLIINTTPLGMGDRSDESPPIPYHFLNKNHKCFDLVYTPRRTGFISRCEPFGASCVNGLDMLNYQAKKSWEIFKGDSLTFDETFK